MSSGAWAEDIVEAEVSDERAVRIMMGRLSYIVVASKSSWTLRQWFMHAGF